MTTLTEKGFAKIVFCDTGVGISDGDLSKIFQPLYTTKPDGTGFGLAACKEIISRHDGSIDVTLGKDGPEGTTFTVNLPMSK